MHFDIEAFSEPGFARKNGEYAQKPSRESDDWAKTYGHKTNSYALFIADSFAVPRDGAGAKNPCSVSCDVISQAKDIIDPVKLEYCQPAALKMYLADSMGLLDGYVKKANELFGKGSERQKMVLTELGVAYMEHGRAYFTSAGHPYIAVCRRDSVKRVPFTKTRLLGGAENGKEPYVISAKLEEGDTIVLATDGVLAELEQNPEMGDSFHDFLTSPRLSAAEKKDVIKGMLSSLHPDDDFTMVLCQYKE